MVARNEMDSGELMLIIEFVMKLSCINSRWLSSLHSCTLCQTCVIGSSVRDKDILEVLAFHPPSHCLFLDMRNGRMGGGSAHECRFLFLKAFRIL